MASGAASPAYPSAARICDSPCYPEYTASLKCLEKFNTDKSKCQEHFDVYKECKKKEDVKHSMSPRKEKEKPERRDSANTRLARLERNSKRSLFS